MASNRGVASVATTRMSKRRISIGSRRPEPPSNYQHLGRQYRVLIETKARVDVEALGSL